MIGRIQRSADFERVLGTPSRARSPHFAVHHLAAWPSRPGQRLSTARAELSTTDTPAIHTPVDDSAPAPAAPDGCWLGLVVPKRYARRSVTRALIKRQIRAMFATPAEPPLAPGLWVVRLRAPFDVKQFPSAASEALRRAARAELGQLMGKLTRPRRAEA